MSNGVVPVLSTAARAGAERQMFYCSPGRAGALLKFDNSLKKVSLLVRTVQSGTRGFFMKQLQSISQTPFECKRHMVWIPKYRGNSVRQGS